MINHSYHVRIAHIAKNNKVEMKKMKTKMNAVLILLLAFALIATPVSALVEGATTVTEGTQSESGGDTALSDNAEGGYINSLDIAGSTQTSMWQGYYGNVTGTLTLEDSSGNSMITWIYDDKGGEVFATTNQSADFTSIAAQTATGADALLSYMDNATMSDSVADTFESTYGSNIEIGRTTIGSSSAAVVTLNTNFTEVILKDGADSLIWTAIINPNKNGFDGVAHDFQMIVPEDNAGTSVVTAYYFFLELT